MIFEGGLSYIFYYLTLHHISIESLYIIWNGIQYEPFYFLSFQFVDRSMLLYFKNPLWKVGALLLKNNYINIFIINLLIYNQFQILNLISFYYLLKVSKERAFCKIGIMIQKMSHLSVHSPNLLIKWQVGL